MQPALIILAQNGYQDKEYAGTRKGLEEGGFSIVVGSTAAGACRGKLGGSEQATVALKDVRVGDYDRIAYIGGPGAAAYAKDPEALRIARETVAAGKVLGAICIAPTILAAAGVLKGKKATVWNEDGQQSQVLRDAGATYTGEPVTVDGRMVTADGPASAEVFGKTLAAL
ncbi:MAG: protease I [Candidatus Peregrinibacteria bacterium Gr01-1014_25]|nr:MAG: protease I [Candidatus Peregrinibacteria bacterium Gr01-1014_25]